MQGNVDQLGRPPLPLRVWPAGHINLIFTTKQTRLRGLEIMTKSEKGQHMHLVQQHKVVALALEPITTGGWVGHWEGQWGPGRE